MLPANIGCPTVESFALPPMWSISMLVLTIPLMGPLVSFRIFGNHLVADVRHAGVHEEGALIADLGHDIAALAGGDQIHVALHGQHLDAGQ